MKIVFNADDFGLSKGVSDGIVESYVNGVVTSTTIMVNAPFYHYAVELAKKHPGLSVGIHLVGTFGYPLRDDVPTLIDNNGKFKRVDENNPLNVDVEEIYKEWCTQIDTVLKDLPLTHFDSHHHIHLHPELSAVVERLSKKYNLPYRSRRNGPAQVLLTESFYKEDATLETLINIFESHVEAYDIMTHPAYLDDVLCDNSSYTSYRETELDILTSDTLKKVIKDKNIQICSYKSIL